MLARSETLVTRNNKSSFKNDIISNKSIAEELQKPIIIKFNHKPKNELFV